MGEWTGLGRRAFLAAAAGLTPVWAAVEKIRAEGAGEDIGGYLRRTRGGFDLTRYREILGAANEFKEGDEATGVAAPDEASRAAARLLLGNTRLSFVVGNSVYNDSVSSYIRQAVDPRAAARIAGWTFNGLKRFLLEENEAAIQAVLPGLASDVIACVVKLMSNGELIAASRKIFHPLPGSRLGAKGYLGARIQPNSPTDDPEDIQWQVFNGFAYAVGDLLLGTNPVSSEVDSVLRVEQALAEVLQVFGLTEVMPHCVLAHIDVQAEAEKKRPGSTALWFQSLAGVADANRTFDLTVEKMVGHAAARNGRYGLYFETGQGADATNGHGKGFDIVMHESRKYGFARALTREVAAAQRRAGRAPAPWVHVNDVAGFIGPEVFRTREQLVRCCLEDTLMGKLHGLTIGLDICSTLHMDVDLDDLDWCIDQVMPANPAYLMALPTKNDPMLSYLTTGFQDHVRVREKFGYKVNDAMWAFFKSIEVLDENGRPGRNFGRPEGVYLEFRRRRGDERPEEVILAEARVQMDRVRSRGVELTSGHGENPWDLQPEIDRKLRTLYADARHCLWAELPAEFEAAAGAVALRSKARDREEYILRPPSGEEMSADSREVLRRIAAQRGDDFDVQIVISDGLNALSLTDEGHLAPFLDAVRRELIRAGYHPAPEPVVVRNGRVRIGYRIGEILFGRSRARGENRVVLHVIGERPGSGHRAYSVYLTAVPVRMWAETGQVDHNVTRVVSGIADTSLDPVEAAAATVRLLPPRP
ncbi:MAG: ethanolamine ammonia-lyase subunit EutB [Bryobacteraceae bacterium]|nr:ethanolamine ammonia-lyase subunit EutB [Bryobacteraceae bacterium]